MNVLALDLARKCGWASRVGSGVWDLKVKPYESAGMKLHKMRANIITVHESLPLDMIFYEKPGGRNYTGVKSGANFEGALWTWCLDNGVDYKGFSAGEMKRFAKETYQNKTGESIKGNLNKKQMVKFAKECIQPDIIDDNHADALWLYAMAVDQFKLK